MLQMVVWCTNNYEKDQRISQLHGQSLISLAPSTFNIVLKLLSPTMIFKVDETKEFMKSRNNGCGQLSQYLEDPMTIPEDISTI